jgi:C_GCAxxG_C_C family probable redox protein
MNERDESKHPQVARAEKAVSHFNGGWSCSQSVLMAYADRLGLDTETASRIAAGFGGGIGHTGRTCGAITGAVMVLGLDYGLEGLEVCDSGSREELYEKIHELFARFAALHGTTECRKLLGQDLSTEEGMEAVREQELFEKLCTRYVEDAARIVADLVESQKPDPG